MFFKSISYLKFILKSTNQHGVHSPFVFSFVTKGLYKKKVKIISFDNTSELDLLSKKQQKILSKILLYFKINRLDFNFYSFESNTSKDYKILFIKSLNEFQKINLDSLTSKHIIIVDRIHQNKTIRLAWQNIIKNKQATVSIDLFYFGLLFFRPSQAKEHFNIRV